MAVLEPPPDGAGVAAVYGTWSKEHFRQGLLDFRSHRPIRSAKHTNAGTLLQRAARAEVDNPVPEGLEPPPPLLGPGDEQPA